jgi:hypothetical protein
VQSKITDMAAESNVSLETPENPRGKQVRLSIGKGIKKILEFGGQGQSDLWVEAKKIEEDIKDAQKQKEVHH